MEGDKMMERLQRELDRLKSQVTEENQQDMIYCVLQAQFVALVYELVESGVLDVERWMDFTIEQLQPIKVKGGKENE